MPEIGNREGLAELANSVSEFTAVSVPPTTNEMFGVAEFSLMVWLGVTVMAVGEVNPLTVEVKWGGSGVLTALTVTVKVRVTVLFWACPSLTVTVIIAEPVALVADRSVSLPVEL